jgi:cyclic pyranopterin phosphate synthase
MSISLSAAFSRASTPLKINVVVKRGVNDEGLVDLARYFKGTGRIVRFIEFMDVGTTNGWKMDDVLPAAEIFNRIHAAFPLEPADAHYRGEVAQRFAYKDGSGEIGIISSVTQPFCGDCTRARLSCEGRLFTCLFSSAGTDFRDLLRSEADDATIRERLASVWTARVDRYSERRAEKTPGREKIEMSYIGG